MSFQALSRLFGRHFGDPHGEPSWGLTLVSVGGPLLLISLGIWLTNEPSWWPLGSGFLAIVLSWSICLPIWFSITGVSLLRRLIRGRNFEEFLSAGLGIEAILDGIVWAGIPVIARLLLKTFLVLLVCLGAVWRDQFWRICLLSAWPVVLISMALNSFYLMLALEMVVRRGSGLSGLRLIVLGILVLLPLSEGLPQLCFALRDLTLEPDLGPACKAASCLCWPATLLLPTLVAAIPVTRELVLLELAPLQLGNQNPGKPSVVTFTSGTPKEMTRALCGTYSDNLIVGREFARRFSTSNSPWGYVGPRLLQGLPALFLLLYLQSATKQFIIDQAVRGPVVLMSLLGPAMFFWGSQFLWSCWRGLDAVLGERQRKTWETLASTGLPLEDFRRGWLFWLFGSDLLVQLPIGFVVGCWLYFLSPYVASPLEVAFLWMVPLLGAASAGGRLGLALSACSQNVISACRRMVGHLLVTLCLWVVGFLWLEDCVTSFQSFEDSYKFGCPVVNQLRAQALSFSLAIAAVSCRADRQFYDILCFKLNDETRAKPRLANSGRVFRTVLIVCSLELFHLIRLSETMSVAEMGFCLLSIVFTGVVANRLWRGLVRTEYLILLAFFLLQLLNVVIVSQTHIMWDCCGTSRIPGCQCKLLAIIWVLLELTVGPQLNKWARPRGQK